MLEITKRFRFEAAHRLEDWPEGHQCHRLHGHSYTLDITLTGEGSDPEKPGALVDFGDIGKIVRETIVSKWDHQYLNDILGERNTTAEFLTQRIHTLLSNTALGQYSLRVRLYETQDGWCDYE